MPNMVHMQPAGPAVFGSEAASMRSHGSLIFDIELDDGEPVELDATGAAEARAQKAIRLATPPSRPAQHLLLHAMNAREQATAAGEELDLATFAQLLANAGHNVWLRTGLPPNRDPAKYVHHTFVVCSLRQPSGGEQLVLVDPQFKAQFAFSPCASRFASLLAALPEVLVASVGELVPLVELMCDEAAASFEEAGAAMPAWRTARPMLARWLPAKAQDIKVPCQQYAEQQQYVEQRTEQYQGQYRQSRQHQAQAQYNDVIVGAPPPDQRVSVATKTS